VADGIKVASQSMSGLKRGGVGQKKLPMASSGNEEEAGSSTVKRIEHGTKKDVGSESEGRKIQGNECLEK